MTLGHYDLKKKKVLRADCLPAVKFLPQSTQVFLWLPVPALHPKTMVG